MFHQATTWSRVSLRSAYAHVGRALCASLTIVTLGCAAGGPSDTIEKAQIAVRANPSLELVATDERQGVLTVKVKQSGRVLTVSAADVVAGTAFRDLEADSVPGRSGAQAPSTAASTSRPRAAGGQVSANGSDGGVDVSSSGGSVSVRRSGNGVAVSTPEGGVSVRGTGDGVAVSTPGGQVSVTGSPNGVSVASPTGQVNVGTGGVQVTSRDQARPSAGRPASNSAAGAQTADAAGKGAVIDDARLDRRTRPVSCVGTDSVDLSGVLLSVDDVAVSSTGSCMVRIRDSHIIGATAVQATGGTTISIENSIIEGKVALALKGSVNMSVQQSTIRGPVQRIGDGQLRDLGNNLWR